MTKESASQVNLYRCPPGNATCEVTISSSPTTMPTTKTRRPATIHPLIECVIFDLDDTLYDCFGQRVRLTHRFAAAAMVKAGITADAAAVYRARMKAFLDDPTLRHLHEIVCRRFWRNQKQDKERISEAARDAYFNCPVGNLAVVLRA